jgi:hypothetical protein
LAKDGPFRGCPVGGVAGRAKKPPTRRLRAACQQRPSGTEVRFSASSQEGGEARIPVLPEATPVGALPAQLRRPRPGSVVTLNVETGRVCVRVRCPRIRSSGSLRLGSEWGQAVSGVWEFRARRAIADIQFRARSTAWSAMPLGSSAKPESDCVQSLLNPKSLYVPSSKRRPSFPVA